MKRTKSRDLSFYLHFFKYNDPADIDTVKLAKEHNVSQQKVAGHLRSAKNNSTITEALIKKGYNPPRWFAGADRLLKRSSTAQVPVNTAQTGEAHASPPSIQAVATHYRSAPLSTRSAHPAHVYSFQPISQSPPNPIQEAHQLLREAIREENRDSLNQIKRGWTPSKPMTIEEIKARAEAINIKDQIESRARADQTRFIYNMIQSTRAKPIDMEETKELFTKPLKEPTSKEAHRENMELSETFEAIGQLLQNFVPDIGHSDEFIREHRAANDKKRKNYREAAISFAKLYMEKHSRKNPHSEMLKNQNKQIRDNFQKNLFKP